LGVSHTLYIHLTLVPYLACAGEIKTKPTQHSVKELRSIGIRPDIVLCRSGLPLPQKERQKIALFTNVERKAVLSLPDVASIYEIPLLLHEQKVDEIVTEKLGIVSKPADLREWQAVIEAEKHPTREVTVAMVGKYVHMADCYKSLTESLKIAGLKTSTKVNIAYVHAEEIEQKGTEVLQNMDAILVPGGFGERGFEGMVMTSKFSREAKIPYLGICLGMHVALIDFARHEAGLQGANSTEFDSNTAYPVIAMITEWTAQDGSIEKRSEESDLGGTMRLGAQTCHIEPGTLTEKAYQSSTVRERHRHRYEVNNTLLPQLVQAGLTISGRSEDGNLVEMIELSDHPWYIGCQFHPEFTSNPRDGHHLFESYINAAHQHKQGKLK